MTRVTQLPVASTISDTGVFVIVDQGVTKQLSWQTMRDNGLRGIQGTTGTQGIQGPVGPTGTVATLEVGTVDMVPNTTEATVTIVPKAGTPSTYEVNFEFPFGPKGDTGVVDWEDLTNNIVPRTDTMYSLGSRTKRWKDVYIGGNTLVLGGTTLSNPTVPFIATLTSAEYFVSTSSISLESVGAITTGSTFEAPPQSLNEGQILYVTGVSGNDVHFEPAVTFTSNFIPSTEISFNNSTELLIDGVPAKYTLTSATNSTLGGVKIGSGVNISANGTISVSPYSLVTATHTTLGGIKVGAGIGVSADGTISVTTGAFALQTATSVILGGVKIGTGIDVTPSGTISVSESFRNAGLLVGSVLASNITYSSIQTVGTLTNLQVSGTTKLKQTVETWNLTTVTNSLIEHNCSTASIFKVVYPSVNWTANFTNVSSSTNEVVSVAVIIQQGSTPHIPTGVRINGVSQVIRWHSGIAPTGNANKFDLVDFSFIGDGTDGYIVLGSLASFG